MKKIFSSIILDSLILRRNPPRLRREGMNGIVFFLLRRKPRTLVSGASLFICIGALLLFSNLYAAETGKIRKHIAAYGAAIDQQKAEFIASHFDLADVDFFNSAGMAIVKSLNPNVIVVGYRSAVGIHEDKYRYPDWPEINSHEEWFTHDEFGHRLMDDTWMSYLMDPGSQGWREHYAQDIKNRLDTYHMFDGIFADDVNKTLSATKWHIDLKNEPAVIKSDGTVDVLYPIWTDSKNKISIYDNQEVKGINYYTGGSFSDKTLTLGTALADGTQVYVNYSAKDKEKFRPTDEKLDSWHSDMVSFLKTAKAAIGDKLLIVNSAYGSSDYLDSVDGTMLEGFVHASWYTTEGYFTPFYLWRSNVDYLDSLAGSGKRILAQSGIDKNIGSDEEDYQMMLYCFGSYLLCVGENTTFNFENRGYSSSAYYYSDVWDVSLGKPVNRYYLLSEGYSGYPDDTGENLLINPSYEQGMAGWGVRNWDGSVNLMIDSTIFKSGNHSMKISVDSGINTGGSLQYVNLDPHTTYTLNGWINATSLQSSAYTAAILLIYGGKDADNKQYSSYDGVRPGAENWEYVSTTITTPDNTSGAYVFAGQIVSAKAGAAWFDDIKLVKGTEYKIFSRDFEKGKVLVNPMYGSATVRLNNEYKTLEGDIVTEVTVGGHQAVILLKEKRGDINSDGKVDVADLQLCVNYVLGGEYNEKADVNEDGGVNVNDIQQVVNWILE